MGDPLLTRASLLARLGNAGDGRAREQFVELYGRLVYGFARRHGLHDADAADLTQEVFAAIARSAGRWSFDARRGSFRSWLYCLMRNQVARFLRRRRLEPVGSGDTGAHLRLAEEPCPGSDPKVEWEREFQRQVFRLAAARVCDAFAPTTWKAFWRTAVEGASGATVAAELGISVGAVYAARSRVLARLTALVQRLRTE
jgi:RNA polymerase sigma-70 factor (ECF subfamily)